MSVYSNDEVRSQIIKIVCDKLSIDESKIHGDSNFVNDLGADSLDSVELIMAIEHAFHIEIGDDIATRITSIDGAVKVVMDKLQEKASQ